MGPIICSVLLAALCVLLFCSKRAEAALTLHTESLFSDRTFSNSDELPSTTALEILSHGSKLFGYVLLPGGGQNELHPCVILLHGFPGHTTNHDLLQSLRRMGCVAVNPFCRGAWGSQGCYSFSGLPEDAQAVAEWCRTPENAARLHIDVNNIFIVGHSMGGFTCINAMRRLRWLKGGVCIAPYDMPWFFENDHVDVFRNLLLDSSCLHVESPDSLMNDALSCYKSMAFSQAFDDLRDRNILFVGGSRDTVAPVNTMILPLWNRLKAHQTSAFQQCEIIDSDHSFNDRRCALCSTVCSWIAQIANA